MSGFVPLTPGDPEQLVEIVLGDYPVVLRARWNTRAATWFLDIWESDATTPIALGLAIVLGAKMGNRVNHRLFDGVLFAYDTSGAGLEASLWDLGGRVQLAYLEPLDATYNVIPRPALSELPP